jgi:hypothetical protein
MPADQHASSTKVGAVSDTASLTPAKDRALKALAGVEPVPGPRSPTRSSSPPA